MEKRISKFLGIALILIGIVLLLNLSGITGFAILQDIGMTTGSIFGIIFVVGGVILLLAREKHREEKQGGLEIFISRKAIKRAKTDIQIKQNLRQYQNEVRRIKQDPLGRPQEIIGEFRVSPRGETNLRVAYHYDQQGNRLYIDDVLYHVTEREYVNDWATKARHRRITRKDYEKAGYVKYKEVA